jgi:hypothetical protein
MSAPHNTKTNTTGATTMDSKNYLVATVFTNRETGKVSTMSETFHSTIEEALAEYQQRRMTDRDLIICKVLQIKVVLVDYDSVGQVEKAIN